LALELRETRVMMVPLVPPEEMAFPDSPDFPAPLDPLDLQASEESQ